MVKALFILVLAALIFGGVAYFSYELFIKPEKALIAEKKRGPEPPPPDPSLPEYTACLETRKKGDLLAARTAFEAFLAHNPQSTKADPARDALGEINADILLSQAPAPEKQVYLVKSGDVLNRVAMRMKTTPELIMRSNNLSGVMLRIGQKLVITPADFSIVISAKEKKVTLFNGKHFFKQYHILAMPAGHVAAKPGRVATPAPRQLGKVVDKIATAADGNRVTFQDKGYAGATHKISISIPGHSLYSVPAVASKQAPTAQNGIGLAPEDLEEIAVLISKNDPVTIE
jgi:LysM repeat protein